MNVNATIDRLPSLNMSMCRLFQSKLVDSEMTLKSFTSLKH